MARSQYSSQRPAQRDGGCAALSFPRVNSFIAAPLDENARQLISQCEMVCRTSLNCCCTLSQMRRVACNACNLTPDLRRGAGMCVSGNKDALVECCLRQALERGAHSAAHPADNYSNG